MTVNSRSYEHIIYEEDGDTARVVLNRPEVVNALSMKLSDEFFDAIRRVLASTDLKFMVISGAGNNFCAGDDITEMHLWGDANDVMRRARHYQNMANHLEELDKITICAVDGYAVGGGLEITMACDFVIATQRARWGMPEVDVGITPGWGGTTRMARLIGRRRTKEINMLGAIHTSKRAVEYGLWNRVVPDDQLDAEVERLLEVLRSKNQQGLRQFKYMINRGVECDLYTAQGFEAFSGALTAAVNGMWQISDADKGAGVVGFVAKGDLWQERRSLSRDFWAD
ncbi:MAG: enoyl-CoA hydratase/isomerase family protein [Actinobacteria bacterium]|jgi:enoyl-CoA hydratase|nr:MAG: enoyl-CoA hydratase/isomerase family protein [Actinomycetota bacterium]